MVVGHAAIEQSILYKPQFCELQLRFLAVVDPDRGLNLAGLHAAAGSIVDYVLRLTGRCAQIATHT